jgi:hypothetical protein
LVKEKEMIWAIVFVVCYILMLIIWYQLNKKRIEKDLDDANKTAVRKDKVQ